MSVRRLLGLLLITAAVTVLAAALALGAYGWSEGMRAYAVRSGSMIPTLRPGDLVIDHPVGPATPLGVGDIITFHPQPGTTVTHRISSITIHGIHTKGDANRTADVGEIQTDQVVGRVAATVPYGGYIAVYFQQPAGIGSLVLFLIAIALAWDLSAPPGAPPAPPGRPEPARFRSREPVSWQMGLRAGSVPSRPPGPYVGVRQPPRRHP